MVTLTDIIEEVPLTPKNGSELAGPCPLCGGTDRFIVRPEDDYCWCRKCEYWANTDKYAHDFNKPHMLDEDYIPEKKVHIKHIPKTPERAKPYYVHRFNIDSWSLDHVEYFGRFGITLDTLQYFGVEKAVNFPEQDAYEGFYIPNLSWWGPYEDSFVCCGGTYRRKEEDQYLHWPKYMNERGQKSVGYYHNYLLSTPDNLRIGPFLNHCFVVEGQKDVMLLTQMGYNAVAFKGDSAWLYYSDVVFQRVAQVLILADDDEAGASIALRVQKGIKRGTIYKIDGSKQITDYAEQNGYDAACSYMKEKFSWVGKGLLGQI